MKKDYHRVLYRQLKKAGLKIEDVPETLTKLISETYESYDEHITRLNHIGEINEKELLQKNSIIKDIQDKEFDSVLSRLPGLVMWVSREMNYLGVNDNIEKLFNKSRSEIVGKRIGTVLGTDNTIYTDKIFTFSNSLKNEDSFEFILNLGDNQRNIVTYAQKFDEGSKILIMGVDTTETVKLQQELEEGRAIETHNARLISLGEMSASIAHEINNPLAILSGNLMLMKKGQNDPKALGRIDKCEESLTRITTILTNIKLMSRNTQNDQMEVTSLRKIIDSSLELIYQKTRERNILINVDFDQDYNIDCHISEMIQVFHNLFNNAIDAIAEMPEQWLKIEARLIEKNIQLKITDCGNGIPEKVLLKLFKPFFTTKPIGKGTGLGMGISLKIIKKHGGLLYYDKESKNTCFIIELPMTHLPSENT